MAFNLASVSNQTRLRAPRIVLLGESKVGKSTLASQAESPIIIQIKNEEGLDDIPCARFPVCSTFQEVMQCISSLYTDNHEYHTVVIDSASALEPLVWQSVCRRNGNVDSIEKAGGGYGKGFLFALDEWRQLVEGLDALRSAREMASILIGHTRVRRYDDPLEGSYDRFEWDINTKAESFLFRWADAILFAAFKTVVRHEGVGFNKEVKRAIDITNGARYLYTQRRPGHPGGGRGIWGRLSYELPLSWPALMDAVAAAQQRNAAQ